MNTAEPRVVGSGALHPGEGICMLAVADIAPDPNQPRTHFATDKVEALADSMRDDGLIQPIAVRPVMTTYTVDGVGTERPWRIIAGERRWRAAQVLGWAVISAVVRDLDDRSAAAAALVENTQREDLTVIELARYVRRLIDQWEYTQADVGKLIGRDRTRVSRILSVLDLPGVLHGHFESGTLLAGHADHLSRLPAGEAARVGLLAASGAWSSRQLADYIKQQESGGEAGRRPRAATKSADVAALEKRISEHLGSPVAFRGRRNSPGGELVIRYTDNDVLEGILSHLGFDTNG